jgi:hypothetical protein
MTRRIAAVGVEFVASIPRDLQIATLYVSIRYRTTAHLCLCGCGEKVVNPLRPNRWSLTYDGSTASLSPSVGNIGLPCRSHYWISRNEVRWLPPMTAGQAEHGRRRDKWPDVGAERAHKVQQHASWWRRAFRGRNARR